MLLWSCKLMNKPWLVQVPPAPDNLDEQAESNFAVAMIADRPSKQHFGKALLSKTPSNPSSFLKATSV